MAIDKINPFIQQAAYPSYNNSQIKGYHQAYTQGAPTTLPTVEQGYKQPTAEEMETALAYLNGDYKVQGNPFVERTQQTSQKAGFEGFRVPENNGTGELMPVIANREDSIENCPWEEYYA